MERGFAKVGAVASLLARARSIPCFGKGLQRLGYQIANVPKQEPTKNDVLVIWNRLHTTDGHAKRYEAAGAKVVICENGWIGEDTYAICLGQHNGAGDWYIGPTSRWPSFGIDVKPWRTKGEHVLVIPQRGMGIPPVGMPRNWQVTVTERLNDLTDRPIRIRYPQFREDPLEPDFRDAHCTVIWGSGAGIKSIVAGVPVYYEMPEWIGSPAATDLLVVDTLERPFIGDRDAMLHNLSWAMWKTEEIERGEPFECLFQ
jgi:hypothetical protein